MRLEIFVLVVAFINLAVVLEFVRRRKLAESFALLWTAVAVGAFLLIVARPVIDDFAGMVGIESGTSVVFSLAIAFLLVVSVILSVHVTRLESRMEMLAEEVALLHGVRHPDEPTGDGDSP
jgi:hypothetical protein